MKLKLILESVNDVTMSIVPNSRLELELSEANILTGVPRETSLMNTDELPEGATNLYYSKDRVLGAVQPLFQVVDLSLQLLADENQELENRILDNEQSMNFIIDQLSGVNSLLSEILGE